MTKPELAGDGLELELRRLLIRERVLPRSRWSNANSRSAGPARNAAGAPRSSGPASPSGRCGGESSRS
eukprot:6984169-Alexandrium_andersonii.AAC.1